jgi:hypothetical protein
MEYRIARLFVWQRYFVRRGREILTIGSLDRATDLDVLALKHRDLFSKETIIVESKTGGEGPLDRVFWLSGVKTFVAADRAFLYRKPTKWNIKDFAKRAKVEIVDLQWVEHLESVYVKDDRIFPGICDPDFIHPRIQSWNSILRSNAKYQELYVTLATESRFDSPFSGVNFWVHHLRSLTRNWTGETPNTREFLAFLIADAVGQLSMFLMVIAQASWDLRSEDRRGMVEKGLTYGEQDAVLARRVFDHAYRLSKATLREYLNRDVELDAALFSVPRPDYVDAICKTIEDIVARPVQAATFSQIADLIVAEGFLKGNRNQGLLRQIFQPDGLGARVALVREFLVSLVSLGALPVEIRELVQIGQNDPDVQGIPPASVGRATSESQPKLFDKPEDAPTGLNDSTESRDREETHALKSLKAEGEDHPQ